MPHSTAQHGGQLLLLLPGSSPGELQVQLLGGAVPFGHSSSLGPAAAGRYKDGTAVEFACVSSPVIHASRPSHRSPGSKGNRRAAAGAAAAGGGRLLLLLPPGRYLDARLLYTGLTRARQRVCLYTPLAPAARTP